MSPKRPFERLPRNIFFSSIIFRKLNEDFGCAKIGRMMSFARKMSVLLVMYGTTFSSDASPPAFSATSLQNSLTIGFFDFSRQPLRNFAFERIRTISAIVVVPGSIPSSASIAAFLKYCWNIGPRDSGTLPNNFSKILSNSFTTWVFCSGNRGSYSIMLMDIGLSGNAGSK